MPKRSKWRLPAQEELEVFLNESGGVSIEAHDPMNTERCVIAVAPEYLPKLIKFLREAQKQLEHAREENEIGRAQEEEQEH
jgi:hypothetical protein